MEDIYSIATMFILLWIDKQTYATLDAQLSKMQKDDITWVTVTSIAGSDHSFFLDRSATLNHTTAEQREQQRSIMRKFQAEMDVPEWERS